MTNQKNGNNLNYAFTDTPMPGEFIEVAKGIFWLRMPLPVSLDHINVWLIDDGDGWTLVDTGLATNDTIKAWERIQHTFWDGRPLKRLIVTHMHPDHVGLAGWLVRRSGAELWMSREEYLYCSHLLNYTHEEPPAGGIKFYERAGFNEQQIDHYKVSFGGFGQAVRALPHSFRRLKDEDAFQIGEREWRVITGYGHSPEHVSLYCQDEEILISGDQLLPSISSNISVWPTEPDSNPMEDWISSLHKLKHEISPRTLVLPSHGVPFWNAHYRIDELINEHEHDLRALTDLCAVPQRAIDVFDLLFNAKINRSNLIMATGESIANFHCLLARGKVVAEEVDGVTYYKKA